MDSTSPTSRALQLLEALQDGGDVPAEQLARTLGTTDRAVRRYVRVLRDAGIPIESSSGRYGGYRLGRGVRLPPLRFTAAEALGLVMAVLDGHHDAADSTDPVGSALAKIVRALPRTVADQVEAVRLATAPAPDRSAARPDPATTTALVQACARHRVARVGYRSEAGTEWTAEVEPWAVVVRHGRWYLLCHSRSADALRAYRVDRVTSVEELDDGFTPPADLDPVAVLEDHLAVGWEYQVEVVVQAPADRAGRRLPRALGRLEPVDDDSTRLVGSTSNPAWYAEQLAALPWPYRIEGCDELRRAARRLAERMLAAAGPEPAPEAEPVQDPEPGPARVTARLA
jgi:predicted DNA-binding transcriptional regulator YafY